MILITENKEILMIKIWKGKLNRFVHFIRNYNVYVRCYNKANDPTTMNIGKEILSFGNETLQLVTKIAKLFAEHF